MGEYMRMLSTVKGYIYSDRLTEAKEELRKLLNCLNEDYKTAMLQSEQEKARKAIVKLLPALEDLKTGRITDRLIDILRLDAASIPALQPKKAAEPEEPSDMPTKRAPSWLDDVDLDEEDELDEEEEEEDEELDEEEESEELLPLPPEEKPKQPTRKVNKRAKEELAPLMLEDYVGQEKAKTSLKISIAAAKKENRALGHLLICSSYGLGKTTLANIIANEMDMPFFTVNATNLKDTKSLSLYFSKIKESCIIFIDEIHSLKNDVQTVLLSILTDFSVSFINEAGEESTFELPPFTLIGATTQAGELLKPFLNRFTILELVDYTDEEKAVIVRSKFAKLGYEIEPEAVADVAIRSRGIPRTIETFAKGIRDIALTQDTKLITKEIAEQYFVMYDIDALGLNKNDLRILQILAEAEKPLALITLESKTGIQKEDLAYRYEPYLLKLGFIDKTDRGRMITQKGREYISPKSEEPVNDVENIAETTDETVKTGDVGIDETDSVE